MSVKMMCADLQYSFTKINLLFERIFPSICSSFCCVHLCDVIQEVVSGDVIVLTEVFAEEWEDEKDLFDIHERKLKNMTKVEQ